MRHKKINDANITIIRVISGIMPLKSGLESIHGWLGGISVLYLLTYGFARKNFLWWRGLGGRIFFINVVFVE